MITNVTQRHGWLWCTAAALLFGAATPVTKLLVGQASSVALAGLLYLGAALAVAPFAVTERRSVHTATQRGRLMLAVVFGGGVAPVLLLLALDRTPAGTVALLLNLELVATAVIAWAFLHEHIGRRTLLGIAVVVAGTIVLTGAGTGLAFGVLLVAAACVCWGIDNAVTASLDAYSPKQITLTKGIVAGSVNLALGIALTGIPAVHVVLAALAIGAFGYGLSITMWITGARLVGAARGQAIFALAPFVGTALSWPINDDRLSVRIAVAFGISLIGVVVVGTAHHAHEHRHSAIEHAHPIDSTDPHHAVGAIEIIAGERHQHLAVAHLHDHLPDIHHRHVHESD